ncbi:ABC transporter ATP-binding protein [Paenibacillus sp. HB172176]|uniref:ABC transporter ATP-binding protein n=1 Tax=Paenibacillus sp. HB172176 TaxID=2493690 RepID=UPI0014389B55|nr:ABC transporter ATP-binding protein [Paenibacillus sp. HB172176]
MDNYAVIQVSTVTKHYGPNNAIHQVSLQVERGELFGIIGKNGAGKTTLLELMMGHLHADEGSLHVLGYDIQKDSEKLRDHMNIFMQSTSLIDKMTVREALLLFQSFYERKGSIDDILEQFRLAPVADKLVKRLSGGLRQRTSLALAVVHNPDVIFLDEPTTGLDIQAKKEYWDILSALKLQGKTIVIVSHDMSEIHQHCDRVGVMRDGKLVVCNHPNTLITELPGGGMTMEAVYMHYAVGAMGGVER